MAKGTVMGGQQVCNQACRPCNDGGVTVTTQQAFLFFFPRKVDFGAKLSREETQERATNVGPVKNQEKKREREREREREGRKDQKMEGAWMRFVTRWPRAGRCVGRSQGVASGDEDSKPCRNSYLERTTCCKYSVLHQISKILKIHPCNCFTTHVLHQQSHVLHEQFSCNTCTGMM